jgi:hypothetical protein
LHVPLTRASRRTVSESDSDARGGPCGAAAPVVAGGLEQAPNLGIGQILAGPIGAVRSPGRDNCSVFSGWGDPLEVRFPHNFPSPHKSTVRIRSIIRTEASARPAQTASRAWHPDGAGRGQVVGGAGGAHPEADLDGRRYAARGRSAAAAAGSDMLWGPREPFWGPPAPSGRLRSRARISKN